MKSEKEKAQAKHMLGLCIWRSRRPPYIVNHVPPWIIKLLILLGKFFISLQGRID
jgi:hypothetical protein